MGQEEKLVSVIVSVYNNLPRVKAFLNFFRANTSHPHELILVDNASTDGTREFLELQPDITLLKNKVNLDDSGGINQGLRKAQGEFILKTDTDVFYFKKGWLEQTLDDYAGQSPLALAGKEYRITREMWEDVEGRLPSRGIWHKEKWLFNCGRFGRQTRRRFERLLDKFDYIPFIHGGRMFMHRSVFERVGFFDEKHFPHNGMEIDYSLRAVLLDVKLHHSPPLINGSVHYGELNDYGVYLADQGWRQNMHAEKEFVSSENFESQYSPYFV